MIKKLRYKISKIQFKIIKMIINTQKLNLYNYNKILKIINSNIKFVVKKIILIKLK